MQELTTYFDNTRYDNLTSLTDKGEIKPDGLSAKPAKLSAFAKLKTKVDTIKTELANQAVATPEPTLEVETKEPETNVEATPVAEPSVPEEEPKFDFPSKEALEAKMEGKGVTIYNTFEDSKTDAFGRKLRIAPQVKESAKYAKDTVGVEYVQPTEEMTSTEVPEVETQESVEEESTFDFSALPGVDVNETAEESYEETPQDNGEYSEEADTNVPYEENYRTEQDDRLNDYLNRENYNGTVDYSGNYDELEEIRKLKREIEEAKESLMQVNANVSDLQQKDSIISEQLAEYKRNLMQEKEEVNAELVDKTREWDGLTKLVRQKEALMGNEESYGMRRSA